MNTPHSAGSIFTGRRTSRSRTVRRSESTGTSVGPEASAAPDEPNLPVRGTMARTKRLILAALRVWELKHGIRE